MAKKVKESELFEIVHGFNIPDGDGEKRFEPGKKKFVTPSDFDADVWKALVAGGAVQAVTESDPTVPDENEEVVFEVVNG